MWQIKSLQPNQKSFDLPSVLEQGGLEQVEGEGGDGCEKV